MKDQKTSTQPLLFWELHDEDDKKTLYSWKKLVSVLMFFMVLCAVWNVRKSTFITKNQPDVGFEAAVGENQPNIEFEAGVGENQPDIEFEDEVGGFISNVKRAGKMISNLVADELEVAHYIGGETGRKIQAHAFKFMDINGDGKLDKDELKALNNKMSDGFLYLTNIQIDKLRENLKFPKFDFLVDNLEGDELLGMCQDLADMDSINLQEEFDKIVGTGLDRNKNLAKLMGGFLDKNNQIEIAAKDFSDYLNSRRYFADDFSDTMETPKKCQGLPNRRKLFLGKIKILNDLWKTAKEVVVLSSSIGAAVGEFTHRCIQGSPRCNVEHAWDVGFHWHNCLSDGKNPVGNNPSCGFEGLRNAKKDCWNQCGRRSGVCTIFCGNAGACCRKGWDNHHACQHGGCDGRHCCIPRST